MKNLLSGSDVPYGVRIARAPSPRSALALTRALCATATLALFALSASSPASAQFMCTTTASDINCTNSGTAPAPFTNTAAGANQNATTTNSGTANGVASETTGGGNATATNFGNNVANGFLAQTDAGGNATATNAGSNTGFGGITVLTMAGGNATATNSGFNDNAIQVVTANGGNATVTNSGTNGTLGVTGGLSAVAVHGGDATIVNSGTNFEGGIAAVALGGNASVTNSGTNTGIGGVNGISAIATGTGNATVVNSGVNNGPGITAVTLGSGNATITNSGSNPGLLTAVAAGTGNAAVTNSGTASGIEVVAPSGNATLTNILGGRVLGAGSGGGIIDLVGVTNTVNFEGGNWLFTIASMGPNPTINTGGAPFVVSSVTVKGITTSQVAVLDPTTFALADRSLTNFTGEISEMLQDRFAGMSTGAGGTVLGFAGAPSSPVANEAQAAFSGIPSVAMSYASGASRPVLGKAPAAPTPYYDTTIWASGFGGERKQRADADILPTTDTAFGGAMGIDRALGGNLRLGVFVGAGASREAVELDVQKIDATYVFGGAYGRFDWISQYLDFSLYGGGINNKSTREIANNTVASGIETATASYGGWFINPEVTYGYRIPFNAVTVTPRLRVRYVGGQLDGYSESGSMQNLSVGRRSINDLEERGEVELSTVAGAFKGSATIGIIGLERLGNPNINTVLLGQNLAFVTPGQASAFGGVVGLRAEYRVTSNVALFAAGEATAMSDKSDSFAASGGAKVSF